MICTIGHRQNYLRAIEKYGIIQKLGRQKPCEQYPKGYVGGYAFKSIEDAQKRINEAYLDREFEIFGMDANWETDTMPSNGGWWHNLINDADIIILEIADAN